MTQHLLRTCGLSIASDRPLPGIPVLHNPPAEVDLSFQWDGLMADQSRPLQGESIVDGEDTDGRYAAVRTPQDYRLRFFGQCDALISTDLSRVTYRATPTGDDDLIGILLAGTTLALVATLRGRGVLHASAVEIAGRATAFLGRAGMGKSALTAAACGRGALLVAEDVLVLAEGDGAVHCHAGNRDIRLRDKSRSVVDEALLSSAERTVDDRTVYRPARTAKDAIELERIIVPLPDPSADRFRSARIPTDQATMALLRFPRVVGLRAEETLRSQLKAATRIAASIPVETMVVPWGPPFDPGLGASLLEHLASSLPQRS